MDSASLLQKIPKMRKSELILLLQELRTLEHEAQHYLAHQCDQSGCDGCKECKLKPKD